MPAESRRRSTPRGAQRARSLSPPWGSIRPTVGTVISTHRGATTPRVAHLDGRTTTIAPTGKRHVGPSTAVTFTPTGVPSPPALVAASPADAQATVTWQPPAAQASGVPGDNGSAITGYTVTTYLAADGSVVGEPVPTDGLSLTVSNLSPGASYYFTVTATNGVGTSNPTQSNTITLASAVPYAPSNFTAVQNGSSASLNWQPPLMAPDGTPGDDGSPITSYLITLSPPDQGPITYTVPSPDPGSYSLAINGLNSSTDYTFFVHTVNAAGAGIAASSDPQAPPPDQSHYIVASQLAGLPGNPHSPHLAQGTPVPDWSGGLPQYPGGAICSACQGSNLFKLGQADAIDAAMHATPCSTTPPDGGPDTRPPSHKHKQRRQSKQ